MDNKIPVKGLKKIAILCGEPSGDLHGEKLIQELLEKNPSLEIHAVAGPKMRKHPIKCFFPMEKLQVMGFVDVFLNFPKLLFSFYKILKTIKELNPDAVVFIDYPGLHLKIAQNLRKSGFKGKLIHYICPSVWAWGKSRIPIMEKTLDLLITFFPFEELCFSKERGLMQTICVGHPLASVITSQSASQSNILAIFPGSRKKEILRNLPLYLALAKELKKEDPQAEIHISIASEWLTSEIQKIAHDHDVIFTKPQDSYLLMQKAKLCLATSGTVTLELALHKTPTIVGYSISAFEQFLALKIFKISLKFYCLANIAKGEEVFAEFFGSNFTKEKMQPQLISLWKEADKRQKIINSCEELHQLLANTNAAKKAVQAIIDNYILR